MHFFEEHVAKLYGVHAAVLLQNIWYWCEKNRANGKHLHDGRYWTYNSERAFSELFPYLSKWQIRNALEKLKDAGVIETRNFNQVTYDRTLWYTVTEKGEEIIKNKKPDNACSNNAISILENYNMEIEKNQFGNSKKSTPIPDIKPDINITNNKPDNYMGENPPCKKRKPQKPKSAYGEYQHVKLTDDEYIRLCNDYGEDTTREAIRFLDEYIEEKGYKSKSHNLAMRRWVFDAISDRKTKSQRSNRVQSDYDWNAVLEGLNNSDQ